jgi:hypothetical protein
MRTVSYFTHHRPLKQGRFRVPGKAWLSRVLWSESVELPAVRRVSLFHPELPPAFDGLRIVQVADLHAGAFMPPGRIARVRSLVQGMEPDLIVFTGDQLDRRDVDADHFVQGLAGLDAPSVSSAFSAIMTTLPVRSWRCRPWMRSGSFLW